MPSTGHVASLVLAQQNWLSNSLVEKLLLVVTGALLGFFSSYALDRIKAKREPLKRLSWDASVRRALIDVSDDIKSKVGFLYEGTRVTALTHIRCTVTNTGNHVVKDHTLRFPFDHKVKVLQDYLDPVPEQELGIEKIEDSPEGHPRYRIGHLERDEAVVFNFVTAGGDFDDWRPRSHNEEGGVDFQRRDVTGLKQDQEHLLPFFTIVLLFVALPPMLTLFDFGITTAVVTFLVRAALLAAIVPHVRPLVRIVQRLITQRSEPASHAWAGHNHNNGKFVQIGTVMGDLRMHDPKPDQEATDVADVADAGTNR